MNYLICIDDTDMPGTKGTGWLAQELGELILQNGGAKISAISRHQLFVHDDVPYTSHNSAMCFELSLNDADIGSVTALTERFLEQRSHPGSDPGLCVIPVSEKLDRQRLIDFGRDAKKKVLTKADAYALADHLNVHLSEHGGTGQGVVGALAGTGLRLSGSDGRYRGWYHLGQPGDVIGIDRLRQYDFIDDLVHEDGIPLAGQTHIFVGSKRTKTVRMSGRQVVVVKPDKGTFPGIAFRTITQKEAKQY